MSVLTRGTRRLASGVTAQVLRIDCTAMAVRPLFLARASAAEERIALRLGAARLGGALHPVPPASHRIAPERATLPGLGEVTLLAERARPVNGAKAAPLHLVRLAAGDLAREGLLINGNYFLFLPPEVDHPWNAYGDPIGLTLAGGVVETPPVLPRAALLFGAGRARIAAPGFADVTVTTEAGEAIPAHPFGPPVTMPGPVAYALFHGSVAGRTPQAEGAEEVAYVGRHAIAAKTGGGMPIPASGCVLRGAGGARLTYRLSGDAREGVQAGPALLPLSDDPFAPEHMTPNAGLADTQAPSPWGWKADLYRTRAARLAAGIDAAGALFFVAVEGTSSFLGVGTPEGATFHDLAVLMQEEGAVQALHLDGGGSTQVFGPAGGALIAPRDIDHGAPESGAQIDRPLPLALHLT